NEDRRKHAEPRSDAEIDPKQRRDVGTQPDIERVAERQLAGVAHHQVPGLADIGEIENQRQHRDQVAVGDERSEQQQHKDDPNERALTLAHFEPKPHHARRPISPWGRNTRTAINSPKENMLFIDGSIKNPASASDTPIKTPPTSAPAIEPRPPT